MPKQSIDTDMKINALHAFDQAVQRLTDMGLDSKTVTSFAKAAADVLTHEKIKKCQSGQCHQNAEHHIEHRIGYSVLLKAELCEFHYREYNAAIKTNTEAKP